MKLAVFLPNWIGDVAMATPALRALRQQYPTAEITGIMRPYVADVLAGTELLDRSVFYNPRGRDRTQRGWAFIRNLRAERFDTVLLLTSVAIMVGPLLLRARSSRQETHDIDMVG